MPQCTSVSAEKNLSCEKYFCILATDLVELLLYQPELATLGELLGGNLLLELAPLLLHHGELGLGLDQSEVNIEVT